MRLFKMENLEFLKESSTKNSEEKNELEKIVLEIDNVEDYVKKAHLIESAFYSFVIIGNKAISVRTHCWACLGRILNNLQNKYNADQSIDRVKTSWSKFCKENFTNFNKTRRDNAKRLAEAGKELEKFYYLGIDKVLKLITTLQSFKNNAIDLKATLNLFGLNLNDPLLAEDTQKDFASKLNKFLEYSNTVDKFSENKKDTELFQRCTTVGCVYTNKVSKYIDKLVSEVEKQNFLLVSIAGRAFNIPNEDQKVKRRRSSISLVCKLLDNYELYVTQIDKIPVGFDRNFVKELCALDIKIDSNFAMVKK